MVALVSVQSGDHDPMPSMQDVQPMQNLLSLYKRQVLRK
jgi:hypothetical protein